MKNTKEILNKIKEVYTFKTDTEFAKFLGIKQNTLSNWRSRNTIDYELISSKCEKINANWLLTGEGDILNEADEDANYPDTDTKCIQIRVDLLENKCKELREDLDALTRSIELIINNNHM